MVTTKKDGANMITPEQHETIITLSRAGLDNKLVWIEYEYLDRTKGCREVLLKPSHFVKGVRGGADRLHIVGYDPESEGVRQLAVSNIKSVRRV